MKEQDKADWLKEFILRENPFHCATCQTGSDYNDKELIEFAQAIRAEILARLPKRYKGIPSEYPASGTLTHTKFENSVLDEMRKTDKKLGHNQCLTEVKKLLCE